MVGPLGDKWFCVTQERFEKSPQFRALDRCLCSIVTPALEEPSCGHPRWTFHFTPTSASWLNAVEGFFAVLTKRRLKRGVFRGVVDLQAAINRFVAEHNQTSKPFTWTADPDRIIAAAARGHQVLDSICK